MSRSKGLQQGADSTDTCSVVPTTGGDWGGSTEEAPRSLGIKEWDQGRNCSLTGARSWPGQMW